MPFKWKLKKKNFAKKIAGHKKEERKQAGRLKYN